MRRVTSLVRGQRLGKLAMASAAAFASDDACREALRVASDATEAQGWDPRTFPTKRRWTENRLLSCLCLQAYRGLLRRAAGRRAARSLAYAFEVKFGRVSHPPDYCVEHTFPLI